MKIMSSKKKSYYNLYGLSVDSFLPLTNVISNGKPADVEIKLGKVKSAGLSALFKEEQLFSSYFGITGASKKEFYMERHGYGSFFIKSGREVIVEPDESVTNEVLIAFLTGPVMGILLHQRENLVLHASAVEIEGRSCIFLGDKGYGKSTLAAHLQFRGHKLISDDIVPIQFRNDIATMIPGYAQIRLLPDSVFSIGLNPQDLSITSDFFPKHRLSCNESFLSNPTTLSCIFILEKNTHVAIEKMTPVKSFIEIIRNAYIHRYIDVTESTAVHFNKCQKLVQTVPAFRLKRPHDYSFMSQVIEKLELHMAGVGEKKVE